jgi:hypothetical protein
LQQLLLVCQRHPTQAYRKQHKKLHKQFVMRET